MGKKTTKSWSPDSVDLATPSVISQVSDSRSSKSPGSPSLPSSKARKNDPVTRFLKTEKKQQQQKPSIYDKLFKIKIFLFFCSTVMFRVFGRNLRPGSACNCRHLTASRPRSARGGKGTTS